MADYAFTGKIYFTSISTHDELTGISFYLLQKAIDNKIVIGMYCSLSTPVGVYKYPTINYLKDGYIPFDIVSAPWSSECEINGIWYADKDFRMADISESLLPNIQNFFEDIITHEKISYIMLEIDNVDGYPHKYYEHEISADKFCQTIIDTPNHNYAMPTVRLKIIKPGDENDWFN